MVIFFDYLIIMNYYFNSPEQVKRDMAYDEYKFALALHYYQCGLTAFNKIATQRDFVNFMKFKNALAYSLLRSSFVLLISFALRLHISNSIIHSD